MRGNGVLVGEPPGTHRAAVGPFVRVGPLVLGNGVLDAEPRRVHRASTRQSPVWVRPVAALWQLNVLLEASSCPSVSRGGGITALAVLGSSAAFPGPLFALGSKPGAQRLRLRCFGGNLVPMVSSAVWHACSCTCYGLGVLSSGSPPRNDTIDGVLLLGWAHVCGAPLAHMLLAHLAGLVATVNDGDVHIAGARGRGERKGECTTVHVFG